MKRRRFFAIAISLGSLLSWSLSSCSRNATGNAPDILIGTKGFTEQVILGELLAQYISANTDLVAEAINFGGTFLVHSALLGGNIQGYIEYTGTAYVTILGEKPIGDREKVNRWVREQYAERFNVEVLPPLGFDNNYAVIIRREDARKYNIKTLSEVARYTPQWRGASGYEFIERQDGYLGLKEAYDLKFQNMESMNLGLLYRALLEKKVDLIVASNTDGLIEKFNLVVLEDDRRFFPPYEGVPLLRKEALEQYPQLRPAFEKLAQAISTEEMRYMNYQVDAELRPEKEVAREFLLSKKLISPSLALT